jgi:CelD/BcsL family acetyltransferase involved in cellulose biosynthesis
MLAAAAGAAIQSPPATLERIDRAGFSRMRDEWNELIRSSRADCLFLTWEWLHSWWNHLAEDRELAIVAVRSGHRPIALAPLAVRPRSLTRFLPEAEFPGSGFAGSDYPDIIVRAGYEAEAARLLCSDLSRRNVTFRWNNLRRECEAAHIAWALRDFGWTVVQAQVNVCPFISLRGHTWESYLATLGSEHRYNLNRKSKRFSRDYEVRLEQAQTETQCREGVDRLIALHNLRWQSRGGSDAFHTAELADFHREFAALALKQGWLRLFTLFAGDRPAACLYGFLYRRKFYFYQSGFHPDFEKNSPGLILMGMAIQQAIGEGANEFDLLHGDEPYKRHWTQEKRAVTRLEVYPPTSLGWASRSSRKLVRSSRALLRSMGSGRLSG